MQKPNYPLKNYIKAVEQLVLEKGLSHIRVVSKGGSIVRFELFEHGEEIPASFWVIHHGHNKNKSIISKEDYRKAATRLMCTTEDFIEKIQEM